MKKTSLLLAVALFCLLILSACRNERFTVTFNSNGGSEVEQMHIRSGVEVNFPTQPTKAGYRFDGWFLDNNVFQVSFDNRFLIATPLRNNITVFARWQISDTNHPIERISVTNPTRTLYALGESLDVRGSRVSLFFVDNNRGRQDIDLRLDHIRNFDPNQLGTQRVEVFINANRDDVEYVMASFNVVVEEANNLLTVNFETNGGSALENVVQRRTGSLTAPTVSRPGFALVGWFMDAEFTNQFNFSRSMMDNFRPSNVNPEDFDLGDFTLYAKWEGSTLDLSFRLLAGNAAYEVIGFTGLDREVWIPSFHNARPVTRINAVAFTRSNIETVRIPHTVTVIDPNTFSNIQSLRSIEVDPLNTHFRSIDGTLFNHDATELIQYAIGRTETTYTIPDTVQRIRNNAFHNSRHLQVVNIPSSVSQINSLAFSFMQSLTQINLIDNNHFIFEDGVLFNSDKTILLLYLLTLRADTFTVPSSVEEIGDHAFQNNSHLRTVIFGNNLRVIGVNAFSATQIERADLPNNLYEIRDGAFNYSRNLQSVVIPLSLNRIGRWAFANTGITEIVIPEHIRNITDHMFAGSTNLVKVTLHDQILSIGNHAFHGVTSLEEIHIYGATRTIGEFAFARTTSLLSVTIDYGVEEIRRSAFAETRFTSIELPDSITAIRDAAFFRSHLTEIKLPSGITQIHAQTFAENRHLEEVIIPVGVERIGIEAFSETTSLKEITIPYTVTVIDSRAFFFSRTSAGTTSVLESIIFETGFVNDEIRGLVTINSSAFANAELREVIFPATLETIGSMAFFDNQRLTRVEFNEGLRQIGSDAFRNNRNLAEVVLPSTITQIDRAAFHSTERLMRVYVNSETPFTLATEVFNLSGALIFVPHGTIDAFRAAPNWSTIATRLRERPSN
ncbi:MAG: leucine-rich repeat protein [Erysipelotrichales bacterium]|nr:leucine-rich repeat protein [Erysipelotrichales bacterium]